MTLRTETAAFPRAASCRACVVLAAALLFSISAASAAVAPYIADIVGEYDVSASAVRGKTENGDLRLIGTFKVYNPDTLSFYLWVSFDNGGKFERPGRGSRSSAIRLIDMELRYRDVLYRPIVKAFPKNGETAVPYARRYSVFGLSGGGAAVGGGGAGRFGKKKTHEKPQFEDRGAESGAEYAGSGVSRRSAGAVEIVFWREDAQPYYEMELWGVLYAPDVRAASSAGRYMEKINFEIEPAR